MLTTERQKWRKTEKEISKKQKIFETHTKGKGENHVDHARGKQQISLSNILSE